VIVIEHHDPASRYHRAPHPGDSGVRPANPLQCTGGVHYVEGLIENPGQDIAPGKVQVRNGVMLLASLSQQRLITVYTQNVTLSADHPGNVGCDRPGSTTDIKDRHAGTKHSRQPPMVALKRSATQDTRIRLMGLVAHHS
jgi:hypothetical protein